MGHPRQPFLFPCLTVISVFVGQITNPSRPKTIPQTIWLACGKSILFFFFNAGGNFEIALIRKNDALPIRECLTQTYDLVCLLRCVHDLFLQCSFVVLKIYPVDFTKSADQIDLFWFKFEVIEIAKVGPILSFFVS